MSRLVPSQALTTERESDERRKEGESSQACPKYSTIILTNLVFGRYAKFS